MRMRRRPFFPGAIEPRRDIFGLHHVTLLQEAFASPAEKDTIENGVVTAFKAAIAHLGEAVRFAHSPDEWRLQAIS
jgi:hypothetical protein